MTVVLPSRFGMRIAVLAAFALAAFFGRAESAQASFAWAGDSGASASSALACASAGGPCFYINVIVHGNGKVTSTAAENGMRVECPAANGFNCTTDPWFNWVDFGNPGMIEFTATPTAPATFQGWANKSTGENGCPPDDTENFPERIHKPAANRCRIWQLDAVGNDGLCLEANFSTGTQVVGPTDGCENRPGAPVGSPVNVTKAGTGKANGTVTSSPTGINCGSGPGCSWSFVVNPPDHVTLTATVGANTIFAGWSGGPCSGSGSCTWDMAAETPYNITATFNSTAPPPPPPPPVRLDTVLLKKPPKATKSKNATFYWIAKRSGSQVFSFRSQCKLDKQSWKACRSGKTYRKLKPGNHTFRVRAGDTAGWDPKPAAYTWKIKR